MRMYFNLIVFSSLFLTACYPCKFLDWNCNQSIGNTDSYKKSVNCEKSQQKLAKEKLSNLYTEDVEIYIINKCIISNGEYKFESDSK